MKALTVRLGTGSSDALLQKVRNGQQLGFENFDLVLNAVNLPVAGLLRDVRAAGGRVRSLRLADPVHIRVDATRAGFSKLASCDESVRAESVRAVMAACKGIGGSDVANVILDAGDVVFPGARELKAELDTALDGDALPRPVVDKALARRGDYANAHLEALCKSAFEILKASEGVTLAFLTPDSPLGVALPGEMEHLLKDGGGKRRAYWHSTCNARELEKAGIVPQEQWLDRFGTRMAGVYLSDTVGGQGWQAPGLGEVDFKRLKPYLGTATARVLAIADDTSTMKLRYGAEFLGNVGIF